MNKKKLVAVLALTGAVANLGLATAFAQLPPPATPTGTETIGCNGAGGLGLDAPPAIGFESRSTNFASDPAGDAPAENVYSDHNARIVVSDTRGYKADDDSDTSTFTDTCGHGFILKEQSDGLSQLNVDGSDFNIQLGVGTVANAGLGEAFDSAPSSPSTLVGAVVNAVTASSDSPITSSVDLVSSKEAFYGDVYFNLAASNSPSIPLNALQHGLQKVAHSSPFTGTYNGPIPTGDYTGTITFTLADNPLNS